MTTETDSSALAAQDYEAIEAAVMETTRGRWFLHEYARRNRQADTLAIIATLERLEKVVKRERNVPDIDRIRLDLADMAEAISRTKQEISQMKVETDEGGRFSEASHELDAIVSQTEHATNEILLAAEKIQELAWTLREHSVDGELCDQLDTSATEIYTACSFQDLTGQRTRKVVTVLRYLESRINSMIGIWGLEEVETDLDGQVPRDPTDLRPDAHLLNGPQLTGRGADQQAIDDIIDFDNAAAVPDPIEDDIALVDPSDQDYDGPVGVPAATRTADVFAGPAADDGVSGTPAPDGPRPISDLDLSDADVFAPAPARPPAVETAPVPPQRRMVETRKVGNTVVTIAVAPAAADAAEPAPALAVVAVEDPIAALTLREQLITFG